MSAKEPAYDAVIVGAGAAGSLFAARFAGAGKRVLVLETGPAWTLGDLRSSQIWARRLKWGGPAPERSGSDPFGFNMSTGWGFGGAALHHYAGWPRLLPDDFRLRSQYGRGRDWPIDYDTLRPHYDRIQAECGISGDAALESWRPAGAPYPMPPLKVYRQGEILAEGFRKLGLRVAPAPLAINSRPYRGRPACIDDGWCDAGCPIQALANPLVIHIPAAKRAGATFQAQSTVTKVLIESAKRQVIGVEYVDAHGTRRVVRAPRVVLAASSVQNARLLLASAQPGAPRGLGNDQDLVGRYFSCHMVVNAYGLFAEPTENHLGVSAGPLVSQPGVRKDARKTTFGSHQWGLAPSLKPNDLLGIANTRPDIWGRALEGWLRRATKHLAAISAVCETVAGRENRIDLGTTRDAQGVPLARVSHSLHPQSRALADHAGNEGLRIMKAAGATESWRGVTATAHPLGGTIMGRSAADSVTDSHGYLHGMPGLQVAGGGLFPTTGGGSPTFTILALAERASEHALLNW